MSLLEVLIDSVERLCKPAATNWRELLTSELERTLAGKFKSGEVLHAAQLNFLVARIAALEDSTLDRDRLVLELDASLQKRNKEFQEMIARVLGVVERVEHSSSTGVVVSPSSEPSALSDTTKTKKSEKSLRTGKA